ncbi:DNA-3-methyladenine glycosylase I [uncultured Nocardioides sp.]|uniref:DNA-3-methyladenine glycosylase I n=1 Tax=uncultured Nocardioides sp. TaxID=198441 RepID=UPI00261FEB04|nr:DNA-3-methyladenine glycosylase I [uncultured Nocardioides sp.]
MTGPVVGDDGVARCPWAGTTPGDMRDYHDHEWGRPIAGDAAWFERLSLEAFQSGLSWATILRKRPAFRAAFDGFDPDRVAAYDDADVERLMADAGIVRNRAKVLAAIANAGALVAMRETDGPDSLERLVRAHAPAEPPAPRDTEQQQTTSPESLALSKALKERGFTFVGPTTMFALMEATGVFDPHLVGCHRRD